jgi:hypothetical protein
LFPEVQLRFLRSDGGLAQSSRRRVSDMPDVIVGEFGQRLIGAGRDVQFLTGQPGLQLADRAATSEHVLVGYRRLQIRRDRRRADAPPPAAGHVQLAL